eukprot:5488211-Amphidinium_carterae.2
MRWTISESQCQEFKGRRKVKTHTQGGSFQSDLDGSDGTADLRARFVARGFSQFIEDPGLIYAATPHIISSLKLLLTIATQMQWRIAVTDIPGSSRISQCSY